MHSFKICLKKMLLLFFIISNIEYLNAETLSLTYSDHEPLGNMRTTFLNEIFFPTIEKESKGRIHISCEWGGKISSSYEALKTVQEGKSAQMTVAVPEYYRNIFPLQQLFKSFPIGPIDQEQINFFSKIYQSIPELNNEFVNNNCYAVFMATGYPVAFYSKNELSNLKLIKGQKWRTASFWHKDFLINAEAVPVTMPWGEKVFEALNNNVIDGLIVNIDSGYDIGAHKVAKFIATSPKLWLGHVYPIVINRKIWNSLTEDDKSAFNRAAIKSYEKLGKYMELNLKKLIVTLKREGAKIRMLTDDEVKEWVKITQYEKIQDKWGIEQEKIGISNVQDTIKKLRKEMIPFLY